MRRVSVALAALLALACRGRPPKPLPALGPALDAAVADGSLILPDGSTGAGVCGGAFTTFERVEARAIPDASSEGVLSIVDGGTSGWTIGRVRVRVDIEHPFRGDLQIALGDGESETLLLDRVGGGADDVREQLVTDAFAGRSGIEQWYLTVRDLSAADVGTLRSFSLDIERCDRDGGLEPSDGGLEPSDGGLEPSDGGGPHECLGSWWGELNGAGGFAVDVLVAFVDRAEGRCLVSLSISGTALETSSCTPIGSSSLRFVTSNEPFDGTWDLTCGDVGLARAELEHDGGANAELARGSRPSSE